MDENSGRGLPEEYYDSIAKGYDALYGEEQEEKMLFIRGVLNPSRKSRLLDVGCGTFASFDLFDCEVYGVEPSGGLASVFFGRNPSGKSRLVVGSAENADKFFDKGFFDFVICVTAAHHFVDVRRAFRVMKSLGAEDCVFAFSLLGDTSNFSVLKEVISEEFVVFGEDRVRKDVVLFCRKK